MRVTRIVSRGYCTGSVASDAMQQFNSITEVGKGTGPEIMIMV